jgi:aspartyl protease family protein
VHFMVDTGASMVALTRDDAQRIGLQFSDGDFTGAAQTAGGQVKLKPVTLDRVTLGALEANQVEAAIVGEGLGQSLLGQSWLRQVGKVTIEGDRMVLR